MDITGHFESASCVIEVDGNDTLAQVKGKLLAELDVPRARHVGVRMRGGGDIGDEDVRICDTALHEGCAVELYLRAANITYGVLQASEDTFALALSPCDRYLAATGRAEGLAVSILDTETHECLCRFDCLTSCELAFSPCSEWISCVSCDTQCAEVRRVKTGALEHSFGDERSERWGTAWSPCGTKLLSCCSKGLQVWDIVTGRVVHEWEHIVQCLYVMLVAGDRVAMFGNNSKDVTLWDYTTGVEVLVLTCPSDVHYVALTPNQRFVAACCTNCVRVWNIETGECIFEHEDVSTHEWLDVAVSNDVVAAYASTRWTTSCMWSISTGEKLFLREFNNKDCGLAISSCGSALMYGSEGVEIVDISHLS